MTRAHAKLSASGSSRWLACPASATLEEDFPDTTSEAAREGTVAHELAEYRLSQYFGISGVKPTEPENGEMSERVDEFVVYVVETYNTLQEKYKEKPSIFLERQLDFSKWVEDGFGTGDVTIIAGNELHIIDLKYGKGVEVFAENNSQLRLYGLGAYNEFELLFDIESVSMHIAQVRLESYTTETLALRDLLTYGEKHIKPTAIEAFNGSDKTSVGAHCRFCKAKAVCRAQADHNLKLAQYEFKKPAKLNIEEVAEILEIGKEIITWYKSVEEYALGEALKGNSVPGYKLVEGRSNRKYTDTEELVNRLIAEGFEEPLLFERKLLSLTNMEKLVGKKEFNSLCGDIIEKPQGKPTLVHESDKREPLELSTPENEFEVVE